MTEDAHAQANAEQVQMLRETLGGAPLEEENPGVAAEDAPTPDPTGPESTPPLF